MNLVRFPNGKVWNVNEYNTIEGTVLVPGYVSMTDIEKRNDALSEAVTGSIVGLTGFAASHRGGDIVWFRGTAEEIPEDETDFEESGFKLLSSDSPELRAALAEQFELNEVEVEHAMNSLENETIDDEECVIDICGSHRQIRTPAYPGECNYVRVLAGGIEIAQWCDDEWRDDPAVVMGALLGAAAKKGA